MASSSTVTILWMSWNLSSNIGCDLVALLWNQLKDIRVDYYFAKVDFLSTEGTVWFISEIRYTWFAGSMVHGADNEGSSIGSVVSVTTDIAFIYVL